jgi:cytochrome oxidase Cu insertion factor (SCO1/SenC/PrrC family)
MRIRRQESAARARAAQGRLPRWLTFAVAPFVFSLAAALAVTAYVDAHSGGAAGANPAGGSAGRVTTEQLMNLAPLQPRRAPAFALTDQRGTRVTLASFRGKAVLLGFYDSRCTQVCPVVAEMLRVADTDLGLSAARVAFVGVNVNPAAASVADVRRFSVVYGLARLPNWYFLTGPTARLAAVWRAYGISVSLAAGAVQTVHADYLYFLDPLGTERYLAEPVVRQKNGVGYLPGGTITRWGQGIAHYLKLAGGG